MVDNLSAQTEPLAKAGRLFRAPSGEASLSVSRVEKDSDFNGALYSLKAFGIATALVVAGGAAGVWGVKTYLGAKNAQEFASTMRLTILDKWPLLTSRIHRSAVSDSTVQFPRPVASSESLDDPRYRSSADEGSGGLEVEMDGGEWNWPAAQARLVAAYERGGVTQIAEVVARELEAELEHERRKRRIGDSVEGQS